MAAKDLTKRTKFAFTKKQLKDMFDEAISVNPYEKKNGHEILRTSLIAKNCLPPTCTTRLVRERLKSEVDKYKSKKAANIAR